MASSLQLGKKTVALDDGEGDRPIASVQRALQVLNAFLGAEVTLTLAELAERTGLPRAALARILNTLERQCYVTRTPSGEFHVGEKPLRISSRFLKFLRPDEIVLPVLRELVEQTGESASYIIPKNEMRISLYRVHSPHPIRDHGAPGDMAPLNRGAAGRIFTAFRADGSSATEDASEVRQRLVAVTHGELHAGMTGMASPVFDVDGQCVGAIGLTGPETRFTARAIAQWEVLLLKAARLLTRRLGGDGALFDRRSEGTTDTLGKLS